MAVDTSTPRSRRELLLGGIGAVAGALTASVGRPLPTSASSDRIDYTNDQNAQTVLTVQSIAQGAYPRSGHGLAVYAGSAFNVGVFGSSGDSVGVEGSTFTGNCGVFGHGSNSNTGVAGMCLVDSTADSSTIPAASGVFGFSEAPSGIGVFGRGSKGRGGQFEGSRAQLRLVPSVASTHPATGSVGDLFVDNSSRLWFCVTGGRQAVWKLVSLHSVPAP